MSLSGKNIESDKNKFWRKMTSYKALKKIIHIFSLGNHYDVMKILMSISMTKIFLGKSVLGGNAYILMSSCLLSLLMKTDVSALEDILANYSQNTTKKQSLRELTVPPDE